MKTSELIGPALDWAAEKSLGTPWSPNGYFCYDPPHSELGWFSSKPRHSYSSDWSQGGPIISRKNIDILHCQNGIERHETLARIHEHADVTGKVIASAWALHGEGPERDLIAAMRCYVSSELGDEVEIPKELL